jgi:hypothetical protein
MQLIARAALCVATGVPLSILLRNISRPFVAVALVQGVFSVDTDKNKLRDEVTHFIEEYDDIDDEALDDLLIEFLVTPYPTREGQDN